ncbi:MAG: hypothetical protein ACOYEV_15440 [Candidatus Nanopelagicales bacterium]
MSPVQVAAPFRWAIRSELVKISQQRQLLWATLFVVTGSAVMAVATSRSVESVGLSDDPLFAAHLAATAGIGLMPYLAALLGAFSVTGEMGSGISRVIFSAVPARWPVLAAKALVMSSWAGSLAGAGALIGFFVSAPGLLGAGYASEAVQSGFAAVWVGCVISNAAMAAVGVALGGLILRSSGVVLAVLGMLVGLPVVGGLLSQQYPAARSIASLMPLAVANTVSTPSASPWTAGPPYLGQTAAYAVLAVWVVGLSLMSVVVLRRRDLC